MNNLCLRCTCAINCTVLVVAEVDLPGDDSADLSFELYEHISPGSRRRDRVRVAISVLRGREPYTHGLILSAEDAGRLVQFLETRTTREGIRQEEAAQTL